MRKEFRYNRTATSRKSRIKVAKVLGKPLPSKSIVHHVDEDTLNDSNDNLVLCQDKKYHELLHMRMRSFRATGDPHLIRCCYCDRWLSESSFYPSRVKKGECKSCCKIRADEWRRKNQDRVNRRYREIRERRRAK